MRVFLPDSNATAELGFKLGQLLAPGDLVVLAGELGTGKTTLAQGLARGLGVTGPVTSPTFTIIQEYQGRCPFNHLDVYRLEDPASARELGLEEYFYGQGVTAIEWGERLEELLPCQHLRVELEYSPGGGRLATLTANGQHYSGLLEELKQSVSPGG
ncbi:MAG: tRNA (adenosine(37)-N6)-threonylcarbamoyltransferase complex ATPase subunit type 1 TsaE [Clostridia bacterium]|nr:tRNA (adenosine(37)-N6)-threonylcarbamoyltransferase complex ATPase subunit type 1 TsaE [Clostridia bacterium]